MSGVDRDIFDQLGFTTPAQRRYLDAFDDYLSARNPLEEMAARQRMKDRLGDMCEEAGLPRTARERRQKRAPYHKRTGRRLAT